MITQTHPSQTQGWGKKKRAGKDLRIKDHCKECKCCRLPWVIELRKTDFHLSTMSSEKNKIVKKFMSCFFTLTNIKVPWMG